MQRFRLKPLPADHADNFMHVHRRQFVIGPRPLQPLPGWQSSELTPGLFLSHCPELAVKTCCDAEGRPWCLLGLAVQTDAARSEPAEEIGATPTKSVPALYRTWAGRWVLAGDQKLHLDACGLLSCFYYLERTNAHRRLWVSSSPSLLSELFGLPPNNRRLLGHDVGIDWYVLPLSRFRGLHHLFPTQILDLVTGHVNFRPLLPEPTSAASYDEQLDAISGWLITGMQRMARSSKSLWLALTAGNDSRVLFATALKAGARVKTFTNLYRFIKRGDVELPPKLAAVGGCEHHTVRAAGFSRDLAELFDRHTGGHCVDQDRVFISRRQFDWCQPGEVILQGNVFEIGRCWMRAKLPGTEGSPSVPSPEMIMKHYRQPPDPFIREGLLTWTEWVKTNPTRLDWRDRFFIEQRMPGWYGSIEQALDLINAEKFTLCNSHQLIADLLALPLEKRRQGGHHSDLIRRMQPELLNFPINPKRPKHAFYFNKYATKMTHLMTYTAMNLRTQLGRTQP